VAEAGDDLPSSCTGQRPELRDVAGDGHEAACHFSERVDTAVAVALNPPPPEC
jgi:hypothetical protein